MIIKEIFHKQWLMFLRIGLFLLFVIFLLNIVDLNLVLLLIWKVPLITIFILLAMNIFRAWLTGIRWYLLNPDITGQLSQWQYFRFVMIAFTFNLIMPGALGGDFAKTAITLKTVKVNKIDNVIAIIADRFVGLISILFLGLVALLLSGDTLSNNSLTSIFLLLFAAIIVVAIITNKSILLIIRGKASTFRKAGHYILKVIDSWQNALAFFKANKSNVINAFLICLPIHLINFFTIFILSRFLGIDLSFFIISIITALVWLITSIPITISGAGVRELSMVYLFSLYGVDAETATALSIYTYIIALLLGMIGLLFLIDWGKAYYRLQGKAGGKKV